MSNSRSKTIRLHNVRIGLKLSGWTCIEEYPHFFLWEKQTRSGVILRQAFFKDEAPGEESSYLE